MKITINGVEETATYPATHLGQLLQHITSAKVLKGTFISKVRVNRQDIDINSSSALATPVDDIDILDVEISDLTALIEKNLNNAEEYLVKLIPGIRKAAELLQEGNPQEANKLLVSIIDGMDWFSQIIDTATTALGIDPDKVNLRGQTLAERKTRLLTISAKMLEANKSKDWVLLADLLEYETLPHYMDWLETLPKLRQL
jgi:hypothetical protein